MAPSRPPARLNETVVIAWTETPEAARAVAAAMPFLAGADRIVVLTVNEGARRTSSPSAMSRGSSVGTASTSRPLSRDDFRRIDAPCFARRRRSAGSTEPSMGAVANERAGYS